VGRFREDDVERVREATDLVALVSESVALKKKGRLFWANCPFHGEKTPSFKIDPATQLWHCFGCGRGGDAFGFVMEAEHLEFPDAVRRLAERARIELVEEGSGGLPPGRKERLVAACGAAAEHFHRELTTSRSPGAVKAREYLTRRGFGSDVAKRWQLGYAPSGRDMLVRALLAAGFTREELVEANLALADGASLKDRFFDRIMFPIADVSGRVIAFGGRVVGDGHPKYLNSNETPIFYKSSTLYGLDRARNEIVRSGTALVVEGYTDVIALHEAGIGWAVATLGTALTERHLKLLGRFGRRIVYLFDGDEAGKRAALRAAEFVDWSATPEAGSARVDLQVALIEGGMDPADFVAAEGAEALTALIGSARPLLEFVIDTRLEGHDLASPEGRSAALADAARALTPVRDSLLGKDYMNYLADRLQTDFATVQRAVPRPDPRTRRAPEQESGEVRPPSPHRLTPEERVERELVRLATVAPSVRARARDLLTEGVVGGETERRLLELVLGAGSAVGDDLYASVAREDRSRAEILAPWLVDVPDVEQVEYAFREVAARVKDFAIARLILTKKAELRRYDPKRDPDEYDRLFGEIAELQRAQQELRTRPAGDEDGEAAHIS
jgi:DNA primase